MEMFWFDLMIEIDDCFEMFFELFFSKCSVLPVLLCVVLCLFGL